MRKPIPARSITAPRAPARTITWPAELIKNLAGLDMVHVPYKGSTGARTDILSGQIDLMFNSVPTPARRSQAGHVKALGTHRQGALGGAPRGADHRGSRHSGL